MQVEKKCSMLPSGKEFLKRKGDPSLDATFLLIEDMAAVAGRGERCVLQCVCFWGMVVTGKAALWVCVAG